MKLCLTCQRCYEDTYTSCAHEDHASLVPSRPGSRLIAGKYRLDRLLGRNFMGTVYTGTQLEQKRSVLVKLLQPESLTDPQGLQHFRREAQVTALLNTRLRHPNVADTYDYGTLPEGGAYMVSELIEGYTLGHYMASSGPQLPLTATVTVARQVADGVEAAHRAGIVHRDLKPSNIILVHDENDDRLQVKVVDFGISKLMQMIPDHAEALQSAQALSDTTRYMSPEQCAGQELDARSDIYSLGCVLYEMLAGRPPLDGDTAAEIARKHIEESPPLITELRPDVPEALAQLVMQALSKKPIIRPQTAAEFARRLRYIDYLSTALTSSVASPVEPARPVGDTVFKAKAGATTSESYASPTREVTAESNLRVMPERNGQYEQAVVEAAASEGGITSASGVKTSRGVTIISSPAGPAVQQHPSLDASVEEVESSETFSRSAARTSGIDVEEAPPIESAAPAAEREPSSVTQHKGVLIIADHAPAYTSPPDVDEAEVYEVDEDTTAEMIPQNAARPAFARPVAETASFAPGYKSAPAGEPPGMRRFASRPLYAGALVLVLALLGLTMWMNSERPAASLDAALVNPTTPETDVAESARRSGQEQSPAIMPDTQPITGGVVTRPSPEQNAGSSAPLATTSAELSGAETAGESNSTTTDVAPAVADNANSVNRRSTPAADRSALRGELNKWLAATNSRNIDKQMAFYQPKVDAFYNSRNFSHDAVRAHKARVFAQANSIDMRADAPQITLGDDGRTATMRFRKRYVIKGQQSSRGELVQELLWVKTDAGWKIASERNVSERLLNERSANERGGSNGRDKNAKSSSPRRRDDGPAARNRRS